MNHLPCEVVRDLLPSYVDGLTSDMTTNLVRQHLDTCPACRARWTAMGAPEVEPAADTREIDFLKKNRRRNRRVILWSALGAALVVIALLLAHAFLIGSAAAPDALACRVTVENGNRLTVTGDVVDSLHVVSSVRFRQDDGAVYITVRTAMPGLIHSGKIDSTYTAHREITQVYVNGRIIWEDGVEISPLAARIFATRHDYVGDMPANKATADAIGIGEILGPFTSSLETSERPYRWTLNIPVEDGEIARAMQSRNLSWSANIGRVLLATVGNLDEVLFLFEGDGYELSLTVDVRHAGNGLEPPDIKACGQSAAGIQRLLDAVYWQRMADWDVMNGPSAGN